MTERERVARGVWDTLGSDYTFDEAVSGSEAPTHAEAVKWVYEVADAALAAMDRGIEPTPADAARLLAHAIAEDGDVMRVMINAMMPHLHADMTADCWNTVTEVRRAVIAGCDAVAEDKT